MKLLILGAIFTFSIATFVNTPPALSSASSVITESPVFVIAENTLPVISAKAYGVFDVETGEMLVSHNSDELLPIASVTKLFTAAAALESKEINTPVVVTSDDVATEGRSGKLAAGEVYQLRELVFPLLLESSNDAAATFERTLGKIPFSNTTLADASGLSSENRATVKELSAEVRRLYLNAPQVFDVTRLKQYVGEHTGWINNSPVFDLSGYRGGKHGYTEAAGRTLVAVFSESNLNDRELGYIILGSDDVRADTKELRSVVQRSVSLESVE